MVDRGRTLATARAVLRLLDYLMAEPDGLTTGEVARRIGKSASTTRYLLNSLCQEGFGIRDGQRYRATPSIQRVGSFPKEVIGHVHEEHLDNALSELSQRTRQRAYLAMIDPAPEVVEVHGHQGQPVMPGVGANIKEQLHGLAIGKVLLASLPDEAVQAYVAEQGLQAFTRATIVDPVRLSDELRRVRAVGYGLDLNERVEGFCCIAAPLFDTSGQLAGAIGVSATSKTFAGAGPSLIEAVTAVARLSPISALTTGV